MRRSANGRACFDRDIESRGRTQFFGDSRRSDQYRQIREDVVVLVVKSSPTCATMRRLAR